MFSFYFSPFGRASRKQIWLGLFVPQFFIMFVLLAIQAAMVAPAAFDPMTGATVSEDGGAVALVSLITQLAMIWPTVCIAIKRYPDRNMSGWWFLGFPAIVFGGFLLAMAGGAGALASGGGAGAGLGAAALPGFLVMIGAGLAQFVILYLLPGVDGPNRFGSDPRTGSGRPLSSEAAPSAPSWADGLQDPAALAAAAGGGRRAAPRAPSASASEAVAPAAASAVRTAAARFAAAGVTPPAGARPAFGRKRA